MDKYVNLVHISGHTGITGNELADVKARKAAHSIAAGKTEASNDILVADAYKLSKVIAMRSWQRKWNEDSVNWKIYSQSYPRSWYKSYLSKEKGSWSFILQNSAS